MNEKIKYIKKAVKDNKVYWSKHSEIERFQDNLNEQDILESIIVGDIIEDYPNDKPLPSCLIYGIVKSKKIHTVVGLNENTGFIRIITVYIPNLEKFENDFKTRRKENE